MVCWSMSLSLLERLSLLRYLQELGLLKYALTKHVVAILGEQSIVSRERKIKMNRIIQYRDWVKGGSVTRYKRKSR